MNAARYRIPAAIGVLAAALSTSGCVAGVEDEGEPIDAAISADVSVEAGMADEIVRLTNIERQSRGLAPLRESQCLRLSATAHARNVAKSGNTSHELYGMGPLGRMRRSGYAGPSTYLENMHDAWSTGDIGSAYPSQAVGWWMSSPTHRANILDPRVTHLGVSVAKTTRDGRVYYYAVQNFAAGGRCRPNFLGYITLLH